MNLNIIACLVFASGNLSFMVGWHHHNHVDTKIQERFDDIVPQNRAGLVNAVRLQNDQPAPIPIASLDQVSPETQQQQPSSQSPTSSIVTIDLNKGTPQDQALLIYENAKKQLIQTTNLSNKRFSFKPSQNKFKQSEFVSPIDKSYDLKNSNVSNFKRMIFDISHYLL